MKPYHFAVIFILSLFFLVLGVTVINGIHYDYRFFADDPGYFKTYQNFGVLRGVFFLYNHQNGRLLSHLLILLICPFILYGHAFALVGLYIINIIIIVTASAFFFRRFAAFRYNISLTFRRSLALSLLIYSVFFLAFFEKRFEWWFWLSSITVYQYSLVLMLLTNGILLTKKEFSKREILLMAICCFAIGFMSEIQAIAQIILITTFLLFIRFNPFQGSYKNIRVKMTAIALIAIPLLINYLSGGNKRKLQLSKTDILSLPAITKSVNIVTHDLVCQWDNIIVHIGNDLEFNAVYAKLFCISVIIFLWILVRRPGLTLSTTTQIDIPKNLNIFSVSLLSISIYLSCLLISALFYANMFDTIFDRCKFLGSFMLVLSLMDLFLIAMFSYPSL